MAITKKPMAPAKPTDVEKFIQAAPDGTKDIKDEKDSVQITLRIDKEQLAKITALAKRQGIARASYIKRAIALQVIEDEKQ